MPALFNALYVGGSTSFIGEATVGNGFIFTATGSIVFTATSPKAILTHKATSGLVSFSGHAPLEGIRSTAGAVTFSGQLGKQYTKTYGGALVFSGTASGSFSGSISVRSSSGGITFEGNGAGFKSKEYATNVTDTYYVGAGHVGVLQVGASKSVNSIIFTGTAFRKSQSTRIATGVLDLSTANSPVSRKRVVVAVSGFGFQGAAVYQRTVRSNIWVVKDAFISGKNEGSSSIWEADALIDAATVPALPVTAVSINSGSDNIWGTA